MRALSVKIPAKLRIKRWEEDIGERRGTFSLGYWEDKFSCEGRRSYSIFDGKRSSINSPQIKHIMEKNL